jgi:hypothetical protein
MRKLMIVAFTIWSGSTFAGGFLNGNDLIDICSTSEALRRIECSSYMMGVVDTLVALRMICQPDHVTAEQNTDIVIKYLREHPEIRHYTGAMVQALLNAFPCSR